MVDLAIGNCGLGSSKVGPGQLKFFVRVVGNFCPSSQKISFGQPENYGMGS